MADTPYDDDLSPEEENKLKELDVAAGAPPTEAEAGTAPVAEPAAAEPAAAAAAAAAAPAPTEEDEYQAWLKANEGKTPEEIARLAFQQGKRANREAFQARRTGETIQQFQTRLSGAIERAEARRANLADRSRNFQQKLETDPDGATKEVFQSLAEREAAEIDREEDEARMDSALAFARQAIPDFDRIAPQIMQFAEGMGYSKAELAGIRDGRDLAMLEIGRRFQGLVNAGICDIMGRPLSAPPAVASTDPRLQPGADPVSTLSSAAARPPGGGKSAQQQAEDLLRLSDEDFDKLDPKQLEELQRALG